MPTVVLRYNCETPDLVRAIETLGRSFDRAWEPGSPHRRGIRTDFGFNLCLVDDENLSARDCVAEAIRSLETLAGELADLGYSLRNCIIDIGLFAGPEILNRTVTLTAAQAATLAGLGIDFEVSFYLSS